MTRRRGVVATTLAVLAAGIVAAGCGGGGNNGTANLNLYIFPEPSGSFDKAAKTCSEQSNGRYTITVNTLPTDADSQRQQLVRRLAAQDSSIDIIGMDVVWTAEFATAGWIKPWTGARAAQVTQGTLPVPLKTATYKGQLWGAPANSNTQLLWYRKDLVKTPPKTWDQMIAMPAALAKQNKPHNIEVQGRQYEGLTVWFNSLVASAGGSIIGPTGNVTLGPPGDAGGDDHEDAGDLGPRRPGLSHGAGGPGAPGLRAGNAAFQVNYPFVWPSAQDERAQDLQEHGLRALARRRPGQARAGTDRRHQPRRRRLHEAPERGLRRRGAACATPPNQKLRRAQGRPAADPERALRRPGVRQGLPVQRPAPPAAQRARRCGRRRRLRRHLAGDLQGAARRPTRSTRRRSCRR